MVDNGEATTSAVMTLMVLMDIQGRSANIATNTVNLLMKPLERREVSDVVQPIKDAH